MRKSSSTAESRNLQLPPAALQNVISFVGLGHHLFVAPVSKQWQKIYAALESQQLTVFDEDLNRIISIICNSHMTFYSSVFASTSRLKLALECGLDWPSAKLQRAAGKHADVATLTTAADMGLRYTAVAMATAARCNKLAEVHFLYRQGCLWSSGMLEEAASSGHFELLRWCCEHGCRWVAVDKAPNYAAESGDVQLMAYVLQLQGTRLSAPTMCTAAEHGHIAMCLYLHTQHCPWSKAVTRLAATGGYTDLLRWLIHNGCPWDAYELCRASAVGGSVDVPRYLQQQGLLMTDVLADMLDVAARNNNTAAVNWLREHSATLPATDRLMYENFSSGAMKY
jgi:hypothetical protein